MGLINPLNYPDQIPDNGNLIGVGLQSNAAAQNMGVPQDNQQQGGKGMFGRMMNNVKSNVAAGLIGQTPIGTLNNKINGMINGMLPQHATQGSIPAPKLQDNHFEAPDANGNRKFSKDGIDFLNNHLKNYNQPLE